MKIDAAHNTEMMLMADFALIEELDFRGSVVTTKDRQKELSRIVEAGKI